MMTLLAKLLSFSVHHRWLVVVITVAVGALGVYNFGRVLAEIGIAKERDGRRGVTQTL